MARYNTAPNSEPEGAEPITANPGSPSGVRDTLETIFIVDVDVHVHADPEEMADYASYPWEVALREIAKVPERYLDLPGMSPRARVPDAVSGWKEPHANRHQRRGHACRA
jgi:hypothetical protein